MTCRPRSPTIAFCTTAKGRLHHLKATLPHNLKTLERDFAACLVLLDYDSNDGLGEWVRQHCAGALRTGQLIYAHAGERPYFHFAHAKNMAHRLGDADILCNLDADQYLAPNYALWLQHQFRKDPDCIVAARSQNIRAAGQEYQGLRGRIALSSARFHELGGYNEKRFEGHSREDIDLTNRAMRLGLKRVEIPRGFYGSVIQHGNHERICNTSPRAQEAYAQRGNKTISWRVRSALENLPIATRANPDGRMGCGQVMLHGMRQPFELSPIEREQGPSPHVARFMRGIAQGVGGRV